MAYTLIEAVTNIEAKLGSFDSAKNNWRYGTLTKMRVEHQPFTATPLRHYFDRVHEGEGSKRTVMLFYDVPNFKELYDGSAGPIVRFIADFTDPTSMYLSIDTGID
jgi:acyl-homoserine lactone acylase PvdQ